MTKQEKIKKIYEVIGTEKSKWNDLAIHATLEVGINSAGPVMQAIVDKFDELCGPKIMIGRCIERVRKNKLLSDMETPGGGIRTNRVNDIALLTIRRNGDKPIEDNPEAIDFIYSLITEGKK